MSIRLGQANLLSRRANSWTVHERDSRPLRQQGQVALAMHLSIVLAISTVKPTRQAFKPRSLCQTVTSTTLLLPMKSLP
jgi:hypothetical protein